MDREIPAPETIRSLAETHLETSKSRIGLWRFDPARAEWAIDSVEAMNLDMGLPFVCSPWQSFLFGSVMGWVDDDGLRRYRRVMLLSAKSGGKTPSLAALGLLTVYCEGERRAEGYFCAPTMEQARIPFQAAVDIVQNTEELSDDVLVYGGKIRPEKLWQDGGGRIQMLAMDGKGKGLSGQIPHFVLVDEFHQLPSDSAVVQLEGGLAKTRLQPLMAIGMNAGTIQMPAYKWYQVARDVAMGVAENLRYLPIIWELDKGDDWKDESVWRKSMPSLVDGRPTIEGVRTQFDDAKLSMSRQAHFKNLQCCEWSESANPLFTKEMLDECERDSFDERMLAQLPCYLGGDLALTHDLAAIALIWKSDEDVLWCRAVAWTREEGLKDRAAHSGCDYLDWISRGYLRVCPGRVISYRMIAQELASITNTYEVKGIALDAWNANSLTEKLMDEGVELWNEKDKFGVGIPVVEHPQRIQRNERSGLWMPTSVDNLEEAVLTGRFRYEKNPMLRASCFAASVKEISGVRTVARGEESHVRASTDAFMAKVMAVGLATRGARDDGLVDYYNKMSTDSTPKLEISSW